MTGSVIIHLTFAGLVMWSALSGARTVAAQSVPGADSAVVQDLVLDDFQEYRAGDVPGGWMWITSKAQRPFTASRNSDQRSFVIDEDGGNRYVRVTTTNQWHRIALPNEAPGEWSLEDRPCLEWDWRAMQLPGGAREDKVNDTGAAVYVYFGRDWLGRPRSIKYSYSTSLPVGTTHSFGPLKLIVVSSGLDGIGQWVHVRRNVVEDYRALFDKSSAEHPALIALWSDTDTTKDTAIADFDNIRAGVCR